MFSKVVITFSTRILTALLSIVNVLIGTNYLGGEGYGTVSLIVLGVSIYLLIHNLLGGGSMVYFASKFKPSSVLLLSYIWAIISVGLFIGLVFAAYHIGHWFSAEVEIVPMEFVWHNIALATIYGFMNIHLNLVLAHERMKSYNFVFLLQHLLLTGSLLTFFLWQEHRDLNHYLMALYISYSSAFILSLIFSLRYMKDLTIPQWDQFKQMLRYGFFGQTANVFQMLNYRLSYYLIDAFIGRGALGVFAASTQISEGIWIFGKSIATVQFARISNSRDKDYAIHLTRQLLKFTLFVTSIPVLIIFFMPVSWLTYLLGEDFGQTREVIRWLSAGTLALAISMMLSHYFSGIGKVSKNTMASGIGVIATLVLGLLLIPHFGIKAAALVNSASYISTFIYLFFEFKKEGPFRFHHMIIRISDIRESVQIIVGKLKARSANGRLS